MWKDFLYFSRTERRGIMVLIALIAVISITFHYIPQREATTEGRDSLFKEEYKQFMTSIRNKKWSKEASNYPSFYKKEIVLKAFDPNTADSITFVQLGLPPWMAKNILRYRAKGGHFRKAEELQKIYGMSKEQYHTLFPYIRIVDTFDTKDTVRLYNKQELKDSIFKYPAGTVIDLNLADTTELKKIPGIGSSIAHMIVAYRKRLGGFYQIEQLQEIHLSVNKLREWFSISQSNIQPINLNKAGIERLRAHPYINFYQAKVIVEFRKKRGALLSLQQLKLYEEFSDNDLERIAPYVCF